MQVIANVRGIQRNYNSGINGKKEITMVFRTILKANPYQVNGEGTVPPRSLRGTHWYKDPSSGKHIYDVPKQNDTPQQDKKTFINYQEKTSGKPIIGNGTSTNNYTQIPFGKMLTSGGIQEKYSNYPKKDSTLGDLDSDKKINEAIHNARSAYYIAKNTNQDLTPHLNKLEELVNHSNNTIGSAQTIKLWDESESKVKKDTNSSIPHDSFNRITHADMINTTPEDIEHISKSLSADTESQWKSLTKDQESALKWYTRHGDEVMNPIVSDPAKFNSLSDPKARVNPKTLGVSREHLEDICDPDDLKAIRNEVLKSIKSLDEATTKMELPSDHLLYRAVDLNHFKNQIPQDIVDNVIKHNTDKDSKGLIKELNRLEGLNFTDPSYGSTSIDKAVAHNFLNTHSRVVLEIAAPKGTKGSWLGDKSEFEEEKEFLMPRSTKYTIVGVRHGVDHVHLQVAINN